MKYFLILLITICVALLAANLYFAVTLVHSGNIAAAAILSFSIYLLINNFSDPLK